MPYYQDRNPKTGLIESHYYDPIIEEKKMYAEIAEINRQVARGGGSKTGGASPEYGQTLATLLLLPIGVHAATTAVLGATAAKAATGAAVGATAGGGRSWNVRGRWWGLYSWISDNRG